MCQKCPSDGVPDVTYLTALSPKDKPWDVHKFQSQKVGHLYQGTILDSYAERIDSCSGYLGFKWVIDEKTGELKLKLNACRFCRCRQCPICQWRRSLMWVARFLRALPSIVGDYPSARYIFLTLTVKNCEIGELRQTLAWMSKAWQRLSERKRFPALGYARATEVTRRQGDLAHPHFHALLMVEPGYFAGHSYLSQADWTELWQQSLRVDYSPRVDVRAVKNRRRRMKGQERGNHQSEVLNSSEVKIDPIGEISSAVVETFKYSVKPSDLFGAGSELDQQWLVELTSQLHKTRSIALGGVFKSYLSDKEPENLIGEDGEEADKVTDICFGWREVLERYAHVKIETF